MLNKLFKKNKKQPRNAKELAECFGKLEKKLQSVSEELKKLQKESKFSIKRLGLIRFNPFKDMGGEQSFSIALLDSNNSGVVITSLYAREGNRVYAKSIEKGKSSHPLMKEEQEAINKALS